MLRWVRPAWHGISSTSSKRFPLNLSENRRPEGCRFSFVENKNQSKRHGLCRPVLCRWKKVQLSDRQGLSPFAGGAAEWESPLCSRFHQLLPGRFDLIRRLGKVGFGDDTDGWPGKHCADAGWKTGPGAGAGLERQNRLGLGRKDGQSPVESSALEVFSRGVGRLSDCLGRLRLYVL